MTIRRFAVIVAVALVLSPLCFAGADPDWDFLMNKGDEFANAGDYQGALDYYRRALDLADSRHLSDEMIAASADGVGALLVSAQQKYAEAEPLLRRSLELRMKAYPATDYRIADSEYDLAQALIGLGHPEEAEEFLLKSVVIRDSHPLDDYNSCRQGKALNALGVLYMRKRDFPRSEAMYKRGLDVWEHADVPCEMIAGLLDNMGILYLVQSKDDQAIGIYQQIIPMLAKAYGDDDPLVARFVEREAEVYSLEGKNDQAEPLFKSAMKIFQDHPDQAGSELTRAMRSYSDLLKKTNHFNEATAMSERGQASAEIDQQAAHPAQAEWQHAYDQALKVDSAGNSEEAKRLYAEALEKSENLSDGTPYWTTLRQLATMYIRRQEYEAADREYQAALDFVNKKFGPASSQSEEATENLGNIKMAENKYAEAETLLKRATELHQASPNGGYVVLLSNLAWAYTDQLKYSEAEATASKALKLGESIFGADSFTLSSQVEQVGLIYKRQAKFAEAEPYYRRLLALDEKQFGINSPMLNGPLSLLAETLRGEEKYDEARRLEERRQALGKQGGN